MVGHRFPSMTRSKVGIVVPPHYFDTTSTELTSLCAEVDVLHTQIRVSPDFGFTLDEIVQTGEEISDCAASLVAAGAEVVLQMGTPFSTAHGWSAGQELQRRITERIGIPFEMMGLSVPAGIHALGARRVALATTYYDPEWVDRYTGYAEESGLEVLGSASFTDQGRFGSHAEAWSASFQGFDPAFSIESIIEVGRAFPEAEAVLVPGMPGRILDLVPDAEAELDRPIVSYFSIWWRCLSHLGRAANRPAGRLLNS